MQNNIQEQGKLNPYPKKSKNLIFSYVAELAAIFMAALCQKWG